MNRIINIVFPQNQRHQELLLLQVEQRLVVRPTNSVQAGPAKKRLKIEVVSHGLSSVSINGC